jgi:hypothetical protein
MYIIHTSLENSNVSIVFYGCGGWSLILKEDHRVSVLDNRVVRGKFGPELKVGTGGWKELHNNKLL